eukprot:731350-Pyramimonas_sp.AAC.1
MLKHFIFSGTREFISNDDSVSFGHIFQIQIHPGPGELVGTSGAADVEKQYWQIAYEMSPWANTSHHPCAGKPALALPP